MKMRTGPDGGGRRVLGESVVASRDAEEGQTHDAYQIW